jgi:hypothetical protein
MYVVFDANGQPLDARFDIQGADVILHSRGGAKDKDAVNADYSKGLSLLLQRLAAADVALTGAWVDSKTVQSVPLQDRAILNQDEGTQSPEKIAELLASRMKAIRADRTSMVRGGNSTKRIRLSTTFRGDAGALASLLGGRAAQGDFRSLDRLPAETLNKATPEFVYQAVQLLLGGKVDHPFGPSTDYDLIADDGTRLPPKAVFGIALSLALGSVPIEPKHFSGGENSACFRLLRDAGFLVIPKDQEPPPSGGDPELDDDAERSEGRLRLVAHFKRERSRTLASAKKAQYLRINGKLTCERCGLDPVDHYATRLAESCIEVHHATIRVADMTDDHRTNLQDLKCLCANCHRLVHRELRGN